MIVHGYVPNIYKEITKLLLGVITLVGIAGLVWLIVALGESLY